LGVKAILFDLDGTLLDTLGDIADCANYALASLGYGVHQADAYKYFVGSGVDKLIERIIPPETRGFDAAARVKRVYLEYYSAHLFDKTRPYDGIPDLLRALEKTPLRLAVVSNKPDDQAKFAISRYFGGDTFDIVIGGMDGVPLKPDPTITRRVLRELSVASSEAMYVGDTGIDMRTAKNAGCISVGVTWGFRPDEVRAAGADYIIDSPEELLKLPDLGGII
jgi:phosphoglycolate phosphatase